MPSQSTSTGRDLCLFALPMLIGNILQSCYSMADMAVVGRCVGADALAAVGNTAIIAFTAGALALGFTIGGNVMVARCRGAERPRDLRESVETLLGLSVIGGLFLTGVMYALYGPVLSLMQVPESALPLARDYMDIVCAGNFFVFGYNAVCAVLRGLGDSRRPVYFIAVAAAVNAGLDLLFVAGFGWGVKGAAAATVLAQAASCAAAYRTLLKKTEHGRSFRITRDKARELFRLGLPTACHSSVLNISYMIVTALFNGHGVAAAAAAGIGLKVNTFVAMPCWAAGQAVTTLAGHAMGAGKPDLAAKIARAGLVAGILATAVPLLGIHTFLRPFLGLFTEDPEVVALGAQYLRTCCSVNFLAYCTMYILNSFAIGIGSPVLAMTNSLLQSVGMRLGLSFLLTVCFSYGFDGLCIAEALSPLPSCLIALHFFRKWSIDIRCGKQTILHATLQRFEESLSLIRNQGAKSRQRFRLRKRESDGATKSTNQDQ